MATRPAAEEEQSMSREPGIVDVMAFYLDLLSRLPSIHDRLWAWLGGLAIVIWLWVFARFIILTADRRRTRP